MVRAAAPVNCAGWLVAEGLVLMVEVPLIPPVGRGRLVPLDGRGEPPDTIVKLAQPMRVLLDV